MKVLGIQIKGSEAILVVLQEDLDGKIIQTKESVKFDIKDHFDSIQVRQFRDQINMAFDNIKADKIALLIRNPKSQRNDGEKSKAPSPISFKLEGIIQLYEKISVDLVWPQTVSAFIKKNAPTIKPTFNYQQDACNLAFYLLTKK